MRLICKKPVSDHIQVAAFPAAKQKGEICVFGSLTGFSDYNTEQGASGSVDVGKNIAVFQVPLSALATAAVGADVYVTSTGTLSAAATGNKLLGTTVAVGSDTFDIAVTG